MNHIYFQDEKEITDNHIHHTRNHHPVLHPVIVLSKVFYIKQEIEYASRGDSSKLTLIQGA